MKELEFNANQAVKVKLTEHGNRVMRDWYGSRVYNMPEEDEYGYTRFQMWYLMRIFGEHMTLGAEHVFDMNMILCVEGE